MDDRFGRIRAVLEEIQEWARASKNDSAYVLPQIKLLDEIEHYFYDKDKEIDILKRTISFWEKYSAFYDKERDDAYFDRSLYYHQRERILKIARHYKQILQTIKDMGEHWDPMWPDIDALIKGEHDSQA